MDRETYEELLLQGWSVSSSKDMTTQQRYELIGRLTDAATSAGVWGEVPNVKTPRATSQALRRLRYHSLWCAVREADLPAFVMSDGRTLEGEALRSWLVKQFDAVKDQAQRQAVAPIPQSILRYLSEHFINPLSNKWLQSFRDVQTKNMNKCYFHNLTKDEVKHLTLCWKEYQRTLEEQSGDVDVPFTNNIQTSIQEN